MKNLNTRRSIRKYAHRDVDEALLTRLLTEAMRTQTMGNMQLYSVVVTRSNEVKAELAPAHFNQPMVMGAPVVLTFCADFHRATEWATLREAHPGYDNLLSFLNATTDALLYCQTFCNLAEEQGLGCCFLGTTVYQPMSIIKTLKLPQLVMPVATITLGWPDEEPLLTDRLPLTAIVHHETYNDYTAADINGAYADKESLPENAAFVKENNVPTLAHVFTDCRYTKNDNELMSASMLEALRHQGFLK